MFNIKRLPRKYRLTAVAALIPCLMGGGTALAGKYVTPNTVIFKSVSESAAKPEINATVLKTRNGEHIIKISAENFEFLEVCRQEKENAPRGHAHIYVNGVKVGSAYYPEFSLGKLQAGEHEIMIMLQTTDHKAWLTDKGLIYKRVTHIVPEEKSASLLDDSMKLDQNK